MKLKLIVMVALAVCVAAAMPTKDEIAKANKEVRESLKAQIAAWKDGKLSDGELSGLMLMHSRKFDDEARRYACLQAAFAAAARAGDAALAANAIEKIATEIRGFDKTAEKLLVDRSLAKVETNKAKSFRYRLETERVKLAHGTRILDETAATIAKMQMVVIPSLDIKEGTTLARAIGILRDLGRKYDSVATDEEDKGFDVIVGGGIAYDEPLKVRRLPASGGGEKFETLEITLPSPGLGKDGRNPSSQDLKTLFSIGPDGVLWPKGSSLVFEETSGKLIVKNTSENLGKLEKIMSSAAQIGVPMPTMPAISKGAISFYDAVKTVAEEADMKFKVDLYTVYIFPSDAKILKAQYDKAQTRKSKGLDGAAEEIVKMKSIVIPSLDIKEGTTLAQALRTLWELGKKYDSVATSGKDKGFIINIFGKPVMFGDQYTEVIMPAEDTTPAMPAISTGEISLYDAMKKVVTSVGMDFNVQGRYITVVPQSPVFVVGAVAKPCKINIHEVRDLTWAKAIELAGGVTVPTNKCFLMVATIPALNHKMADSAYAEVKKQMAKKPKLAMFSSLVQHVKPGEAIAKALSSGEKAIDKPLNPADMESFGEALPLSGGDVVIVWDLEKLIYGTLPFPKAAAEFTSYLNKTLDDVYALLTDDKRLSKDKVNMVKAEMEKYKAVISGMFTRNARKYEENCRITATLTNGKMFATAFELSHKDRGSSVLPRTVAATGAKKDDIAGRGYKSAAEYFTALFDLENHGARQWYVRRPESVLGIGSVTNDMIVADKLDWCIAANVANDTPGNVPLLVTANFNPALLLRKWDGKTDADKILPIGPASGAFRSMFNDVAIVVVYNDGSAKRIDAEELTYAAIYGKPFDATTGNPPLAYLTPTGVAEPTAGKDR